MALTINTNSLSLLAQNNLNKSQSALGTSIERLSSGMRINSARDDAAGQAIANRFTSQIRGLSLAARNANDGISITQVTEGALNEINNNLQRIRELAVQAQNGIYTSSDLDSIQNEIDLRLEEINRISGQTQFNNIKVLSSDRQLSIQIGANDGERIDISMLQIDSKKMGVENLNVNGAKLATVQDLEKVKDSYEVYGSGVSNAANNVVFVGEDGVVRHAGTDAATPDDDSIIYRMADNTFSTTKYNGAGLIVMSSAGTGGAGTTGVATDLATGLAALGGNIDAAATGTAITGLTGGVAEGIDGNFWKLSANAGSDAANAGISTEALSGANGTYLTVIDGKAVGFTVGGVATNRTVLTQSGETIYAVGNALTFGTKNVQATTQDLESANAEKLSVYVGTNQGGAEKHYYADKGGVVHQAGNSESVYVSYADLKNPQLLSQTELSDNHLAHVTQNPLEAIDAAIVQIDEARSYLGAVQNRMEALIVNINDTVNNMTAARGRIEDADYATEVSNMSHAQILQQAGISVLVQANQAQQSVLALLR